MSQSSEDVTPHSGDGRLILFVDDDITIQNVSNILLSTHNYRVLTASDGIEALAVYVQYQQHIDAVIIDFMMPSMDGTTAIRILHKINPSVKIIAISGLEFCQIIAQQLSGFVHTFLAKPYTVEELLSALDSIFKIDTSTA